MARKLLTIGRKVILFVSILSSEMSVSLVWIDEVTNTWKVVMLGQDILYCERGCLQACLRRVFDSQTSAGLLGQLGFRCWGARAFSDSIHLSASASSQPRPPESFRAGNIGDGCFLLLLLNGNCS